MGVEWVAEVLWEAYNRDVPRKNETCAARRAAAAWEPGRPNRHTAGVYHAIAPVDWRDGWHVLNTEISYPPCAQERGDC